MAPEVAYADYQGWGGELSEDDFNASLRAARAAVKSIVGLNEPQGDDDARAYANAVCAAVDVDARYGASAGIGEGGSSVRLGSFSISGGSGSSCYDADMSRAIGRELLGSSLLYQGVVC